MNWIKNLFGSSSKKNYEFANLKGKSTEERKKIEQELALRHSIPAFERKLLTYGYTKTHVIYVNDCPRCNKPMQHHYASFIYATQGRPKAVFAPAGYFCTECPTAVVDEQIVKQGADNDFEEVIGIDFPSTMGGNVLFRMFNDKEVTYTYDESGGLLRMKEFDGTVPQEQEKNKRKLLSEDEKKKIKKKKRLANNSRKINRKKK